MTTLEFMQKELERHRKNYEQQERRRAPVKDLEIIHEKIAHYRRVCNMLEAAQRCIVDHICIASHIRINMDLSEAGENKNE